MKRTDENTAIVTCLNSEEVWYLTCEGVTWHGKYDNCSHGQSVLIGCYRSIFISSFAARQFNETSFSGLSFPIYDYAFTTVDDVLLLIDRAIRRNWVMLY